MKQRAGVSSAVALSTALLAATVVVACYSLYQSSARTAAPAATASKSAGGPLVTYSADAYTAEVDSLLKGFAASTGAQVAPLKSGGSFADANQIAAGAPADVFVSVALSATSSQYLKNLTSNWAVGFASDQMVLAYSNSSLTAAASGAVALGVAASKSNATSDWNAFYSALTSGVVRVGISNPSSDPAGLRGWLVLEAAGLLYAGDEQAYVDPLLQGQGNMTGTSAAALVAPLEAGQIQFLFIYKSAAVSAGLPFVTLDSHVNLGSPSLGAFYSHFSYTDSTGTTSASPIVLFITVPASSVNTGEAVQFVVYALRNAAALSSFGLEPFATPLLYSNVAPPAPIQNLVSQGLVAQEGPLR
jgi:molybdate/tungstate transport system substrate-binding protein